MKNMVLYACSLGAGVAIGVAATATLAHMVPDGQSRELTSSAKTIVAASVAETHPETPAPAVTKDDTGCAIIAAQKLPPIPSLVITAIKSDPMEVKRAAKEIVDGYNKATYIQKQLAQYLGYYYSDAEDQAIIHSEASGKDRDAKDILALVVSRSMASSEIITLNFKAGAIESAYSFVCGISPDRAYFVGRGDIAP